MSRASYVSAFLFSALLTHSAYADQGSLPNSGGSVSVHSSFVLDSTVMTPAGPLTLDCPIKAIHTSTYVIEYDCSGGSFTYLSNDGARAVTASFVSGVADYTCSGGGRGHPVRCGYAFTGSFSGTLTENGREQAIVGKTSQSSGQSLAGSTIYNSAYSPFYFTNGSQVLRSSDLQATNLAAFGALGTGKGQFYGPSGITLDASGRIYVADTYNGRIVRIDNIAGANWTAFGVWGSGKGQFRSPSGVFVDRTGKIYVADTGNHRIVRIDNLSGANWIAYGREGSGVGQFSSIQSLAVDAGGHVYVPDPGNHRLVRIDDMAGSKWTVLTKSPPVNGAIYSFQTPNYVVVDSSYRIYVADGTSVIRVGGMTGAQWTSVDVGTILTVRQKKSWVDSGSGNFPSE